MPDEAPQAPQSEASPPAGEPTAAAPAVASDAPAIADEARSAAATAAPAADGSTPEAAVEPVAAAPAASDAKNGAAAEPTADKLLMSQEELNSLLGTAQQAVASAADAVQQVQQEVADAVAAPAASALPRDVRALPLPEFDPGAANTHAGGIELLDDVELRVKIELGRTEMYVEDVLKLGIGSVVELDKLAGDPVDIFVNDRLIGRGEVLVLNDNFCVRVNELLSTIPE